MSERQGERSQTINLDKIEPKERLRRAKIGLVTGAGPRMLINQDAALVSLAGRVSKTETWGQVEILTRPSDSLQNETLLVADGVGSQNGSEVTSRFTTKFAAGELIRQSWQSDTTKILAEVLSNPQFRSYLDAEETRAGNFVRGQTTVVAAVIKEVAHQVETITVGDSLAFLIKAKTGKVIRINSDDHHVIRFKDNNNKPYQANGQLVEYLGKNCSAVRIREGGKFHQIPDGWHTETDEGYVYLVPNGCKRDEYVSLAVGVNSQVDRTQVKISQTQYEDGDTLVLATDGITPVLKDLAKIVGGATSEQTAAEEIYKRAKAKGHDNITVIVKTLGEKPFKRKWLSLLAERRIQATLASALLVLAMIGCLISGTGEKIIRNVSEIIEPPPTATLQLTPTKEPIKPTVTPTKLPPKSTSTPVSTVTLISTRQP